MKNPLTQKSWSPYVVGAAIGVLSWFAFATADRPLGITTAFEHTAALAEKAAMPSLENSNSYYAEKAAQGESPKIGWEWMLVVGVFIGAAVSSFLSGDRGSVRTPRLWRARFGDSATWRFAGAFVGGGLMMLGARLAQGCTSGHGISGALQLAVSSWLFVAVMFAVAVGTAFLLFGRERAKHV